MKAGTVTLVGRPNSGKSTLVNNLVGHKVVITSPKPQTTQFSTQAVFEDPDTDKKESRGQIIFVDTPGFFAKSRDARSKAVNLQAENALKEEIDVVLYIVDHTRRRGDEENRVLGALRKIKAPKILVINKIDKKTPDYSAEYKFLEDEFDEVVEVSAIKHTNLNLLIDAIFEHLPEGEKFVEMADMPIPALNLSSNLYIEEMIREKAFLTLRKELPYMIRVVVDKIATRDNGSTYVKARIITPERYKKMIIGASAQRIKQISMMTRKELEVLSGKKAFVELTVEEEK
jgi:GTP-binding protein Era